MAKLALETTQKFYRVVFKVEFHAARLFFGGLVGRQTSHLGAGSEELQPSQLFGERVDLAAVAVSLSRLVTFLLHLSVGFGVGAVAVVDALGSSGVLLRGWFHPHPAANKRSNLTPWTFQRKKYCHKETASIT